MVLVVSMQGLSRIYRTGHSAVYSHSSDPNFWIQLDADPNNRRIEIHDSATACFNLYGINHFAYNVGHCDLFS